MLDCNVLYLIAGLDQLIESLREGSSKAALRREARRCCFLCPSLSLFLFPGKSRHSGRRNVFPLDREDHFYLPTYLLTPSQITQIGRRTVDEQTKVHPTHPHPAKTTLGREGRGGEVSGFPWAGDLRRSDGMRSCPTPHYCTGFIHSFIQYSGLSVFVSAAGSAASWMVAPRSNITDRKASNSG